MIKQMNRIGETNINECGSKMIIISYENRNSILVKIDNIGITVKTTYPTFKKGSIKHPYVKSVYGVGYLGEGKHKYGENRKMTHKYKTWNGMMRRCYDDNFLKNHNTYKGCTVAEDWHNFQNFGDWYDKNYYEIEGERMALDKDILVKGNKIYSPDTCVFVPQRINSLFVNCESTKGKFTPCVYLSHNKGDNKFTARTRTEHIGNFSNRQEAFEAYKKHKEIIFRDTANEYKDKIPEKLYIAMLNYKIINSYIG